MNKIFYETFYSHHFNKYYLQVYDGNLYVGHLYPSPQFRETVVLSRSGSICIEYSLFINVDNDRPQFTVRYRKCRYFEKRLIKLSQFYILFSQLMYLAV